MQKKQVLPGRRNKLLLYSVVMSLSVLQMFVFWVIVNFNSILLSFKTYENVAGSYVETIVWFKNITDTYVKMFTEDKFITCIWNSLLFYGISTLGGTLVSLSFSYYIYKKGLLGGFFKVMLYMPHIVSGMVVTVMYKYFSEKGLPIMMDQLFGIKMAGFGENMEVQLAYVVAFNFILSFGANMLVYTGTMASISDSVIEAAQIDGVNTVQEFFYIIMPCIFKTFALFIITGMLTIFTGQGNLFNFYGTDAPQQYWTYGYYMYVHVKDAGINYVKLPPLAAMGLCLTFIAIPIIFSLRYLLNKYGPSEE